MNAPQALRPLGRRLNFLHLSDIHFSHRDDAMKWDLDKPIRQALIADASESAGAVGGLTAVLITGDIAFSGAPAEYLIAEEWLDRLCDQVGIPHEDVWLVPGNHDVDRAVVRQTVRTLHRRLRECELAHLDGELEGLLNDEVSGATPLVTPLAAYNVFASGYDCAVSGKEPYWQKDFELATGYRLQIRGLTTVFISDDLDDDGPGRLVLGSVQTRPEVSPGDLLMTLGHHPFGWLRDGDRAAAELNSAAAVQLWGHRHTQSSANVDGCLQVFAGAVQPSRGEPVWEPRYNILSLQLFETDEAPLLQSELRSRLWSRAANGFIPDTNTRFGYPRVDDLPTYTFSAALAAGRPAPVTTPEETYPADIPQGSPTMVHNRVRRLGFRFARLAYDVRLEIVQALELISDEERLLPDQELFRTAFTRANETGQLAQLWEAIEARHDPPETINPFHIAEEAPGV
jgi:hypothetical protein